MDIYDVLSCFLSDRPRIKHLLTVDGKAFVSYSTNLFEKLNMLNKEFQGSSKTLVDEKTKIFGFVTFIEVCKKTFITNILSSFIGKKNVR